MDGKWVFELKNFLKYLRHLKILCKNKLKTTKMFQMFLINVCMVFLGGEETFTFLVHLRRKVIFSYFSDPPHPVATVGFNFNLSSSSLGCSRATGSASGA